MALVKKKQRFFRLDKKRGQNVWIQHRPALDNLKKIKKVPFTEQTADKRSVDNYLDKLYLNVYKLRK